MERGPSIFQLPPEILFDMADHLGGTSDLLKLSMTCKHFWSRLGPDYAHTQDARHHKKMAEAANARHEVAVSQGEFDDPAHLAHPEHLLTLIFLSGDDDDDGNTNAEAKRQFPSLTRAIIDCPSLSTVERIVEIYRREYPAGLNGAWGHGLCWKGSPLRVATHARRLDVFRMLLSLPSQSPDGDDDDDDGGSGGCCGCCCGPLAYVREPYNFWDDFRDPDVLELAIASDCQPIAKYLLETTDVLVTAHHLRAAAAAGAGAVGSGGGSGHLALFRLLLAQFSRRQGPYSNELYVALLGSVWIASGEVVDLLVRAGADLREQLAFADNVAARALSWGRARAAAQVLRHQARLGLLPRTLLRDLVIESFRRCWEDTSFLRVVHPEFTELLCEPALLPEDETTTTSSTSSTSSSSVDERIKSGKRFLLEQALHHAPPRSRFDDSPPMRYLLESGCALDPTYFYAALRTRNAMAHIDELAARGFPVDARPPGCAQRPLEAAMSRGCFAEAARLAQHGADTGSLSVGDRVELGFWIRELNGREW